MFWKCTIPNLLWHQMKRNNIQIETRAESTFHKDLIIVYDLGFFHSINRDINYYNMLVVLQPYKEKRGNTRTYFFGIYSSVGFIYLLRTYYILTLEIYPKTHTDFSINPNDPEKISPGNCCLNHQDYLSYPIRILLICIDHGHTSIGSYYILRRIVDRDKR